jgi:hypothetical protein
VTGCRRAAFNAMARAWHHRARAHQSRRRQSSYLAALCGLGHWSRRIENFSEVERQVSEALDQVVRASSAVECFNSSLRPYVSVKKHLSQGFLALIALYHNTRQLPQRGNKTPLQLAGVDLGNDQCLGSAGCAAVQPQASRCPYTRMVRAARTMGIARIGGTPVSLWWGGVPLKNKRISAEKIFLIKGGLW